MAMFLLRRLLGLVPVLAVAVVLTFAALQALPGDPVAVMLSDHSADIELAARLRAEYGLDQPLWRQFLDLCGAVAQGDFGLSFRFVHTPVIEVLADSLKVSPVLALAALAVALPLGAFAGTLRRDPPQPLARHRRHPVPGRRPLDPEFRASPPSWSMCFSIKLGVLPVAGWGTLDQAVLPVLILAIPSAAYHRPARAHLHARGAAAGLHPHRARQGPVGAAS